MENMTYLAAQYLAAAGISFLDPKEDDSHTNLGFIPQRGILATRPLNKDGDSLSFNYSDFTLEWHSGDTVSSLILDGTTHPEVLDWIKNISFGTHPSRRYLYKFHYDFPYRITDDFRFLLTNTDRLRELMRYRILAQTALSKFLKMQQLQSEVRVWPHHFDTGAYATVNESADSAIGMGLAVPDTLCADYYFYISGYEGSKGIDTSNFSPLPKGKWYSNGFKGAVLPATGNDEAGVVAFFRHAFDQYRD